MLTFFEKAYGPFFIAIFLGLSYGAVMEFKLIRSTSGLEKICPQGAVVTIGNFDGVHAGHAAMLKQVQHLAQAENLTSVMLTFSPHPRELFQPEKRHHRIMRIDDKARRVRDLGLDMLYVQKFNRPFAGLSAKSFLEDVLIAKLNAKHIVVGEDFVFGKGREGTAESLNAMAEGHGVVVHIVADVLEKGERISSTSIRNSLENGAIEQANILLGHPWCVRTYLNEDESLILRGQLNRYLPIKNAVYWVKIKYTYMSELREETLPLAVKDNEVKIHPIGQIPDIPEGRVLIEFLKLEREF